MSVQRATISAQRMLPDRSAGVLTRKPVTGYVFPFSCPIAKDSAVCTALVPPPSGLFRGRPIARGFFPSRVFPSALGLGNRNISGYGLAIGGFFLLNHPHLIFAGRHIYAGAEAGRTSFAVVDDTGELGGLRVGARFRTASVVKVMMLVA